MTKLLRLTEKKDGRLVAIVNGKDVVVKARRLGRPFVIEGECRHIDDDPKLRTLCSRVGANAYYCGKSFEFSPTHYNVDGDAYSNCGEETEFTIVEPYKILGKLPKEKRIEVITENQMKKAIREGQKFQLDDPKIDSVQIYEDTYKKISKKVLKAGQSLLVGDNIPALLPLIQKIPEYMLFWTFNRNFVTDKGLYIIQDSKGEFDREFKAEELEEMLRGGKKIQGIRFSKGGNVRFSEFYEGARGEHDYKEIARGEFFKANFGLKGAKELAEYCRTTNQFFCTYGVYSPKIKQPTIFGLRRGGKKFDFERGDDTCDKRFTFGIEYRK